MGIFDTAMRTLDIEHTGARKLREKLLASQKKEKTAATPSAPTLKKDAEKDSANALLNNINKQVEGGATQEEAFQRTVMADMKINADTEHTNFEQNKTSFLDDPMVHQATMEAGTAQDELALAKKTSEDFAKSMRDRWDKNTVKSVNTMMGLATDPKYLEWLGALGLSPDTMMKLSKGREGYINGYVQDIKTDLNDDALWMENLDKITLQAEKDWNAKTRVMREEEKRVNDRDKPQDFEYKVLDGIPYNYSPSTGKMTEINFSSTAGGKPPTGLAIPGGNKYAYSLIDDGDGTAIRLNLMEGQPLDDPNTKRNEGWCGSLANDILGIPHFFGDSLKDKNSKTNSPLPQVGGFGVMDVGDDIGHVFYVEKVYRDGSIDIAESNWKVKTAPGTFGRRHIKIPNTSENFLITGYYNPKGEGAEEAEAAVEKLVARYNMATTDSGKQKIQDEATKAGIFNKFSARVLSTQEEEPEEDKRTEATKIMDEFIEGVTPENFYEELDKAIADINKIKAFGIKKTGKGEEEVSVVEQIREEILRRVELEKPEFEEKANVVAASVIVSEKETSKEVIASAKRLLEGYTNEEGEENPPMSPKDVAEVLALSGVLKDIPELADSAKLKWGRLDVLKGMVSPGIPLGKLLFGATDFEKLEKLFEKYGASLKDLL